MNTKLSAIVLALVLLISAGCGVGINRSLQVDDGETVNGGLTTVNGSIRVGRDAEVKGNSHTVNGRIGVDDGSRSGSLTTVNGGIRIGENVTVDGDLQTVNGSVDCGHGTEVDGDVATVNGGIQLEGTLVAGDLSTYNGEVTLRDGTRVKRDLVIERNRGSGGSRHPLEITIRNSVVEGDIEVRSRREVIVYLEEGGEVLGEIHNAEVVREEAG